MKHHYRIMVKNSNGRFMPIGGFVDGKPLFTINVLYGLVLWDIGEAEKESRFKSIMNKYPNEQFDFRRTL